MARLLLGVTGGVAAYKAVELARLAIKAGHSVRAIQTPASEHLLGRATLEGITGAPVLVSEFEPDPLRGAYPGEPPAEHAPISHLVLVTAGGTREPIDSVRYIGNRSSGRMGVALATRAAARGAQVTLLAANLSSAPHGVRTIEVQTAEELLEACRKEFPATDVLLMAAAVADFRPAAPASDKLKKDRGIPPPRQLESTKDVLATLSGERHAGQVLIGFAAEHGADAVRYGRS